MFIFIAVFLCMHDIKFMDENWFGKKVKEIREKKGLKREELALRAGVSITSYQFRHSFATHVLEKTGDLRAVQQLLRHKNISMTTRYATALDKTLRDAVNKI